MSAPYYQDDAVTIYHGDCREILPGLEPVDLVLTDPPYGINMSHGFSGFGGFGGFGKPISRRRYSDTWDELRPSATTMAQLLRSAKNQIIWGGNFFADTLPQSTHWLVWDKLNTMPTFGDCELAWTSFQRKSVKKITIEWNGLLGKEGVRVHPTQKPLALFVWCLNSYDAQTILDPFMGSGTTLRAAKDLGRKAIGIEIEEKYCEIAAKRMAQEVLSL